MFRGLQSLYYLYFEFNVIREIQFVVFSFMFNLKLLFFNNNLLRILLIDVFVGIFLVRFNLRKNYFFYFFVVGVLEYLNVIVQIDFNENSWDCICDLVFFKQWIEIISLVSVVGDVFCRSFENFIYRDVRIIELEVFCLEMLYVLLVGVFLVQFGEFYFVGGLISVLFYEFFFFGGFVSFFVLIFSLLVLFFLVVFVVVGFFVYVFRRRRKKFFFRSKRQEGVDFIGIQMQCYRFFEDGGGGGGGGRLIFFFLEKVFFVGYVYEYIFYLVIQMCNNFIYKFREEEEVVVLLVQEVGSVERGGFGI